MIFQFTRYELFSLIHYPLSINGSPFPVPYHPGMKLKPKKASLFLRNGQAQ